MCGDVASGTGRPVHEVYSDTSPIATVDQAEAEEEDDKRTEPQRPEMEEVVEEERQRKRRTRTRRGRMRNWKRRRGKVNRATDSTSQQHRTHKQPTPPLPLTLLLILLFLPRTLPPPRLRSRPSLRRTRRIMRAIRLLLRLLFNCCRPLLPTRSHLTTTTITTYRSLSNTCRIPPPHCHSRPPRTIRPPVTPLTSQHDTARSNCISTQCR